MNRYLLTLSTTLLLVISVPSAQAMVVTYNFEGKIWGNVSAVSGIFDWANTGLNSADENYVTGTFSFDDGLKDFNGSNGIDAYRSDFANAALAPSFTASITVGTVTASGSHALPGVAMLQVWDYTTQDRVSYTLGGGYNSQSQLSLLALDQNTTTNPGIPDGVKTGSGGLMAGSNTIADAGILDILDNLDLSKFGSSSDFSSMWLEPDGPDAGTLVDSVKFKWTGIERANNNVPEPGTLALLGIGLAGFGFSRRKKQRA